MTDRDILSERALELRRAFDRSFAEPPRQRDESASLENVLAVRLGADPYAIRLAEVSALMADKAVMRVPTAVSAFLGVIGAHTGTLPVYDLRALLGYPTSHMPRWILVAAGAPVGLAFDGFDGYRRLARVGVVAPERSQTMREHVREALTEAGGIRPLIDIISVMATIRKLAQTDSGKKQERK